MNSLNLNIFYYNDFFLNIYDEIALIFRNQQIRYVGILLLFFKGAYAEFHDNAGT